MADLSRGGSERDRIYAADLGRVGDFVFDDTVAAVFNDMVSRSVPGYGSILTMIDYLSRRYIQPNTVVYDLGCSTGAVSEILARNLADSATLIAVDNSPAMVARCRQRLNDLPIAAGRYRIVEGDLLTIRWQPASLAVLNFTLQFIALEQRLPILQRISDALAPAGALILSEKIRHPHATSDRLLIDLHEQFKAANGYSELEISQKRNALERVLLPETVDVHLERLHAAGFATATVWFQCFNFVSIVATKR